MNLVSEFLVMAAMLLDIKSKMLLPKDPDIAEDDNSDPRQDLVENFLNIRCTSICRMSLRTGR